MDLIKISVIGIVGLSLMAVSTAADARGNLNSGVSSLNHNSAVRTDNFSSPLIFDDVTRPRNSSVSETAAFYYKIGVNSFDRGNYEKAERAFKAVLRAKGLNKKAHHYLAKINIEKGELEAAAKHTKAYQTAS